MANDTFDDSDLWQMASDAALDRPADPLHDDLETISRSFHKAMCELALLHQAEKERARVEHSCHALVMIGGEYIDPELDLRIAELDGFRDEAVINLKGLCAKRTADVLIYHLGRTFHISKPNHAR
jgi:hypothetical protein